ncbi:MAG TPA: PHP domain-containing protein [Candidatus Limivivens merdigallinarum]|uniref:PHP domain-containing protein n=1 Tax=Candidatus Limivivens merdigallinarum TaxID=2840859 RepID=A0A9D0ZV75_9FIRM|nr:PHP domain-containing protein [Candidatus Limivivens merdigallinarum]
MKLIDLHVHSTYSDGTLTPYELAKLAKDTGLTAFALTDHDTVDGIPDALSACQEFEIELIPGIEFSTEYQGKDIHIVGLELDRKSPRFLSEVHLFQDSRNIRNRKMIAKLHDLGNIDISWEQMEAAFGKAIWTRAHFARYLKDHGYVKEMKEAFSRYIGDDCPYFVPREKVSPAQAVRLIRSTGGIPILAHPLLYRLTEEGLLTLIEELKNAGLLGIEALYSTHTPEEESFVLRLARRQGLLISGGSDFHGSNKPSISLGTGRGNLRIPYEPLEKLREARG